MAKKCTFTRQIRSRLLNQTIELCSWVLVWRAGFSSWAHPRKTCLVPGPGKPRMQQHTIVYITWVYICNCAYAELCASLWTLDVLVRHASKGNPMSLAWNHIFPTESRAAWLCVAPADRRIGRPAQQLCCAAGLSSTSQALWTSRRESVQLLLRAGRSMKLIRFRSWQAGFTLAVRMLAGRHTWLYIPILNNRNIKEKNCYA